MAGGRCAIRRLISAALMVAAASAALAGAGPDALMPFRDAAGAATEVSVAFVVDFGDLGAPVVGCTQVPSTEDGYAALLAFTSQHGEAPPVYNNAGLLCSIDNLPGGAPTVCGAQGPAGYDYWSYWHGTTGSWVYATTGAFATVQNGDVEGWRYETDAQSGPNDPHPTPAPSYSSICGDVASTSATTDPPTSVTPAPVTQGSPTAGSGGGVAAPVGPSGSGSSATAAASGHGPSGSTGGTATPTAAPGWPVTAGGATGTTTPTTVKTGAVPPTQSLRATPAAQDRAEPGGSAVPGIIGVLLVLALAAGAVFGWRRRARPQ